MPRALHTLPFKSPRQSMHIPAKPRMITPNTDPFYHTHITFQYGGILGMPSPALPASEQSRVKTPSKISTKNAQPSKIHPNTRLGFLVISRYALRWKFLSNSNLYRDICVFCIGEFLEGSIFSGNCYRHTRHTPCPILSVSLFLDLHESCHAHTCGRMSDITLLQWLRAAVTS